MKRFKLSELSAHRIGDALRRRVENIPNHIAWNLPGTETKFNYCELLKYKDKYNGKRCFILGNGPSLKLTDLRLLKNDVVFGLNRIYLLHNTSPFRLDFHVCVNELVLEQFSKEISDLKIPKFLNWNSRKRFARNDPNTLFVNLSFGIFDFFQKDITKPMCAGGTVTYIALQLAYYMGFSEVVLVGVDHNFVDKGIPNKTETRKTEQDLNHFDPNYFPKGVRWQLPDLQRSEMAYCLAREAYNKSGREILDATINGKCPVFRKVDYFSLFL